MKLRGDELVRVPVSEITVGQRVRPLDESAVDTIGVSAMDLGGIVTPLHLRKTRKGYDLIDGLHRLTVAQRQGLEVVPALIWDCSAKEARFMEVDANLSIAHLQLIDVATSLAARKSSYEAAFPETRQGVSGARGRHGLQATNLSFAEYTAKVLGLSRRQIERMIACGNSVTPDEVRWIRSAPRRASFSDLDAISKTPPGHMRSQAIILFSNGGATTIRAALKAMSPGTTTPKDPVEEAFQALLKQWGRAPKAARRRFAEHVAGDLTHLLSGGSDA